MKIDALTEIILNLSLNSNVSFEGIVVYFTIKVNIGVLHLVAFIGPTSQV